MCEICRQYPCHPRCPNYIPPKTDMYCDVCEDGIYPGQEYIENFAGEYIHFECIQGLRWLLEWLGYEVEELEDMDIGYYQRD